MRGEEILCRGVYEFHTARIEPYVPFEYISDACLLVRTQCNKGRQMSVRVRTHVGDKISPSLNHLGLEVFMQVTRARE
jgi:hypothetical protein